MRVKILGLLIALTFVSAGIASACPPCTQYWTASRGCTPAAYCNYCCYQTNQCYLPQHCFEYDVASDLPDGSESTVLFAGRDPWTGAGSEFLEGGTVIQLCPGTGN